VVAAVVDQNSFALVETARLEWYKFEAGGPAAVAAEFERWRSPEHVRLHLDHVPVIDEDNQRVDFLTVIQEALDLGYESVMVDGSRLPFAENVRATCQVVEAARKLGVPVEAELGAVMGHEDGPMPSYEELFTSGRGFTDVEEARAFVAQTGCDWLSVAIGNFHGAVTSARKDEKKIEARLNLERLGLLAQAARVPLVLHGGSGIQQSSVRGAFKAGIAKINVGTEIRQAYETGLKEGGTVAKAQDAVYVKTSWLLKEYFGLAGNSKIAAD
jgi:fructose-bisphosphate aldolase, class II